MQTATHHSANAQEGATAAPVDFVPLHLETRTHVTTAVLCHHLSRKEQTARGWSSAATYPPGLKPLRVMGRLAWPVAGIRAVLGVAHQMRSARACRAAVMPTPLARRVSQPRATQGGP